MHRHWAQGLVWSTRGLFLPVAAMVGYGCVGCCWPLKADIRLTYCRNSRNCLVRKYFFCSYIVPIHSWYLTPPARKERLRPLHFALQPFLMPWLMVGICKFVQPWLKNQSYKQHTTIWWAAATLPPAALPSISIATSAMAPNHGAVTPHESIAGASCGILFVYSTFKMLKNYQKHDTFIHGRTDDSMLCPML